MRGKQYEKEDDKSMSIAIVIFRWENVRLEVNLPNLCNIELDQWQRGNI